jgi:hypothetical protein
MIAKISKFDYQEKYLSWSILTVKALFPTPQSPITAIFTLSSSKRFGRPFIFIATEDLNFLLQKIEL